MIINLLLSVLLNLFSLIFIFLPIVKISDIPYIGTTVSSILLTMVETWNAFIASFPYAGIAWNVLLLVVLPFELLMLLGKFFLGHRLPAQPNN
jgi:hypothetical protein